MISISPACTTNGIIAATLGGMGIGLTAVSRVASLGELLPSSTFHLYGTPSMILTAAALTRAYGSPVSRFFELDGKASLVRLAIAGALVGAGSSFGKGCTSGNGIQGGGPPPPSIHPFVRPSVRPSSLPLYTATYHHYRLPSHYSLRSKHTPQASHLCRRPPLFLWSP